MNLYDHYTDALEKVAQTIALKDLPKDSRRIMANHLAVHNADRSMDEAMRSARAADYMDRQAKRSDRKKDKPGILSSIRRGGPTRAKAFHAKNHTAATGLSKEHSKSLDTHKRRAKEHLTHAHRMDAASSAGDAKAYYKATDDYANKYLKNVAVTKTPSGQFRVHGKVTAH